MVGLCLRSFLAIGFSFALTEPSTAQSSSHAQIQSMLAGAVQVCLSASLHLSGNLIKIDLSLKRDGALAAKPVLIEPPGAFADHTQQEAVLMAIARCAPFKGLANYRASYGSWRKVTIALTTPAMQPLTSSAAAAPAPVIASGQVESKASDPIGLIASAILGLVLCLQMILDAILVLKAARIRRGNGGAGPWERQPLASIRLQAERLDPVSDPKNWRI